MTTTYIPNERAKTLRNFLTINRLWKEKCDELAAAKKTKTEDPARFEAALTKWTNGRMPSKRAKYHAYDDAAALARYVLAVDGTVVKRANTVDDLAATLAAFNAVAAVGAR